MAQITPQTGLLIDACVPRSEYQRCCVLFEYLVQISDVGPHADLDPGHILQMVGLEEHRFDWTAHEDELIDKINGVLPDNLTCTVGEIDPGDVAIMEV